MASPRRFAVFDVDGTIIRWQLYHAIGDGMAKQGIIDSKQFEKVRKARMNWKKRSGEDSFQEYEQALIKVFDSAITGLDIQVFKQVIGKVFDEYKEQVYRYPRDLIENLKKKDYLLFALSGSPQMIVSLLAEYYDFDDYAATDYIIEDGRFTGEKALSIGRKGELLQNLITKHGATINNSLGVGDSEGDIEMLSLTQEPIAFNPTKKLFEHAKRAGWKVVLERKNMVYNLEINNGEYGLV